MRQNPEFSFLIFRKHPVRDTPLYLPTLSLFHLKKVLIQIKSIWTAIFSACRSRGPAFVSLFPNFETVSLVLSQIRESK